MKFKIRILSFVISVVLLGATAIGVATDPGLGTMVTALFAIVAFLSAFSDLEFDNRVPRFRFAFRSVYEDLLRHVLDIRYRRRPLLREYEFRFPTNRYHDRHRVAVVCILDRDHTRQLKSIVHLPPNADPYDIFVYSGTEPEIRIEDLNGDGRPDLFVDYVVGAHTHCVAVFRLDEFERFVLMPGSRLFADWGPVELEFDPLTKRHVIKLLSGSGAAGADAVQVNYVIREDCVESYPEGSEQ